jgi:hypothetical protein
MWRLFDALYDEGKRGFRRCLPMAPIRPRLWFRIRPLEEVIRYVKANLTCGSQHASKSPIGFCKTIPGISPPSIEAVVR